VVEEGTAATGKRGSGGERQRGGRRGRGGGGAEGKEMGILLCLNFASELVYLMEI